MVGSVYASQKPTYYNGKDAVRFCFCVNLYKATYLLGVGHRDLADERTDVDEQVEVHVDPRRCQNRVDDDALAAGSCPDKQLRLFVLFGDERGDVRLEAPRAQTHDNDSEYEASQSTVRNRLIYEQSEGTFS